MSDNWVVQNLENALNTWNEKLAEIWQLITQSPENFKGGTIWNVIVDIHGAVQAIGLALLVLFFVVGVMRTCGNFAEIKRPEQALKLFIRFAIAKGAVTYGLELMMALFKIVQGMISTIMNAAGFGSAQQTVLPQEIVTAVEDCGFFESIPLWAVTLIGGLFITVLSFIMIMSVYGRFFKLYIYTAIAPVPLSAFAGEPSQSVGKSFIKSYAAVCLEGAVIVLACIIFSLFASSPPVVNPDAAAVSMVWSYIGELVFNMLVLVGAVSMLVSNLMFGQGPWTPWQMFAAGIIGFIGGILFKKGLLGRTRTSLCIYGFIATMVIYGGLMNLYSALTSHSAFNLNMLITFYVQGFPMDIVHAVSTVIFLFFGAEPMLEKLDRIKVKYGLIE